MKSRTPVVRVLLADDHALVRSGIRSLLESAGVDVIAEASDGREAVRLCAERKPEIAFLDVAMPVMNGIEAAREIHRDHPEIRIVMLSMHAERQYIYEATRVGASGYVVKDAASGELSVAIKAVLEGGTYLSQAASELAVDDYMKRAKGETGPGEIEKLTAREKQVLQLIGEGNSSADIAALLEISVRTVDSHRQNIMGKLELHSIAELTKCAVRSGLCTLTR